MRCPFCDNPDTKVVDSRVTETGDSIRRRRECERCGNRFTTYERIEEVPQTVVKRDGTKERFDRQKLLRGLVRATNNRPVTEEQLDELADRVAAGVRGLGPEVEAERIGELALRELAGLRSRQRDPLRLGLPAICGPFRSSRRRSAACARTRHPPTANCPSKTPNSAVFQTTRCCGLGRNLALVLVELVGMQAILFFRPKQSAVSSPR